MKNILILSPDRPIESMGGLGIHLLEVLKRVDAEEYNVAAICQGSQNIILENGVKIYGVSSDARINPYRDSIQETFIIQSRFVSLALSLIAIGDIPGPDIVHIMDWSTAIAGEEIAKATNAKTVFAVHLSINNYIKEVHHAQAWNFETAKTIEFEACRKAFRVLQVSEIYAEKFPFMIYKHKTEIVPNGVDCTAFANAQPYNHVGNNPIKIVYIGRIAEMKNVQSLMSINIPSNCDLIFIGGEQGSSDMLIKDLQAKAARIDNLHYIGALYDQEKINAIAAADLVIMPSVHEPFGMVALEALAAAQNGKTILAASFVDGLGEFLNEDAAINCGVSIQSIQDSIDLFLNMSDEEKNTMRQNAVALAQAYDWQHTVTAIENVWEGL